MNPNDIPIGATCSIIPTTCEPVFACESPTQFARICNAPAQNAVIAQDYWNHDNPPMRRAWFCDSAIAEIGQLVGGGN